MLPLRRAVTLAGAAIVVLAVTACGTVHPTLEDLRAVPGATARFPGSTRIQSFDQDSSSNLFAKNQAILKSDWCADGTDEQHRRWYADHLAANGWSERGSGVGSSDPDVSLLQEWDRGDRTFSLYALSSAYVERAGGSCAHGYETTVT